MKEDHIRMSRSEFHSLYINHAFDKIDSDYVSPNEEAFLVHFKGDKEDKVIIVTDAPHSVD